MKSRDVEAAEPSIMDFFIPTRSDEFLPQEPLDHNFTKAM